MHDQSLRSPLPAFKQYARGVIPATVQTNETDPDSTGYLGMYNTSGRIRTADNAFFQSLGSNGRACITCHLPPNSMSISLSNIRSRYTATQAQDPLFAPVDGASCPDAVSDEYTKPSHRGGRRGKGKYRRVPAIGDPRNPYSLLLNRGLIRVFLPWPPAGVTAPEFDLSVVSDPTGCEHNDDYGLDNPTAPMVSVYRRPIISSSLQFVTNTFSFGGPPRSNIMWDGREPTLESQAIDATLGHAQATDPPTSDQVAQIVAFENAIFSAQSYEYRAGSLTAAGATGGPVNLQAGASTFTPGPPRGQPTFNIFDAWSDTSNTRPRQSIARGQAVFNTRTFTISNVAGLNDTPAGNNITGTCSFCHSALNNGADEVAGSQLDIGVAAVLSPDLPAFNISCKNGASTSFNGTNVTVQDLGKALITGKCADIGRFKAPQLRGLAARAPYFHNGSAATLRDVANFYNNRFSIGFTNQEITDLVNFLGSL